VFSIQNDKENVNFKLIELIGKQVIVFVSGGGASGRGFSGVLIEVLSDRIKLITKLPPPPINKHISKNFFSISRSGNTKHRGLGTNTVIMIEHITAITYNYV
jgi:hypothetical protein